MRRYFCSQFHPMSRRTGVTASVSTRKRSTHRPVKCSASLMGFEPRSRVPLKKSDAIAATTHTAGPRAATNTSGRSQRGGVIRSVELAEVHPAIEVADLIGISVEHERRPPTELADASLARLTPPRVIDLGVHVGIEPVFV